MPYIYKNIIVAIDGSTASERAFDKAIQLTKKFSARLILTHVIDSRIFTTTGTYDRTLEEQTSKNAHHLISQFAQQANRAGVRNIVQNIEYGSPKVKIAKEIAKDYDADLIICGATGLSAVERLLMGSVSEAIMRNASCDVLVVR